MARIGNEASAISEHSHEAGEHTEVGERGHLSYHAVALIVEPPARAELDLAGGGSLLEVAEHCAEDVVVLRVEGVEYGLRERVVVLEVVHEGRELLRDAQIVDRVEADVSAELLVHFSVIVSERADMELHRPAELGVFLSADAEDIGLEGVYLLGGELATRHSLIERRLSVADGEGDVFHSVVGKTAAVVVEVMDSVNYPLGELLVGGDAYRVDVGDEGLLADIGRLVGTEGGKDLGGEVLESGVVLEGIRRIVGGADDLYVRSLDEIFSGEFLLGEALVHLVPDPLTAVLVESLVYIEVSLELEVSPVIEGVADKVGHGLSEGEELLVLVAVTGDELLLDAVGTHLTPLVVVAAEEEIKGVSKSVVLSYHLGAEVTVIVDYRKILYRIVKSFCRVCLKHKVIVDKTHSNTPFY